MKKAAFYTLGCKVNQYDTHSMQKLLLDDGYEIVGFDETADVYIINTCTVTGTGDKKSRQAISRAKRMNPNAVLCVAGCMPQNAPETLWKQGEIDILLGNDNRSRLPELINRAMEGQRSNAVSDIAGLKYFDDIPTVYNESRTRAYVKIQEGCENFCTYCIVPFVRGPLRSRSLKSVIKETQGLVEAGFKEIVLTGIHISSYNETQGGGLIELLDKVCGIDGLRRLRLGSLEPGILTEDFCRCISQMQPLCRQFHVSLQSGSDDVLKRMGRKYNVSEFSGFMSNIRHYLPDAAITTDVIVGFPGETEEEHEDSKRYIRQMLFSKLHVFPYSRREGTIAALMEGQIDKAVKAKRAKEMISIGNGMQSGFISNFMGKEVEVLLENRKNGKYYGYTKEYIRFVTEAEGQFESSIVKAVINGYKDDEAYGEIIDIINERS